jgi:hypothetical protein
MHSGTIVGELDRAEATQQKILALALGHDLGESLPPEPSGALLGRKG